MKHIPATDIFLDLTGVVRADFDIAAHVRGLAHDEGLFDGDRRVTIALAQNSGGGEGTGDSELEPAKVYRNPVTALGDAIAASAARARALVIVIGPWRWRNQTLCALAEQAMRDPMIATVQPRFSDGDLRNLDALPDGEGETLPIAAAGFLPDYYVAPECLSALLLLTPRASAAVPRLTGPTLKAAYAEVLSGLRQRGYRNLICNRILVSRSDEAPAYLPLPDASSAASDLHRDRRSDMWREMPERRLEILLSSAFSAEGHPRILLDCRGMTPAMNGTAVCVLGFLQGFQQLGHPGLQITVLASPEGAEYHRLAIRFPEFEILRAAPEGRFFLAAILLTQPWSLAAFRELHDMAGLIMFNILDTIVWDTAAPPNLERAWRVVGQSADVLFFNSAYTRERYRFRFHPDKRVALVVTHHSMKPAEIIAEADDTAVADEPFVLVIGNSYDHKDVAGTVATLAIAFPYTRFISVGVPHAPTWNVTAMESGHLSAGRIARLFTDAIVVVFPSHYEGFGLPVGEALAYGKAVIVRDCPLWSEIGELTRHPERIIPFRIEAELITAVGDALHGPQRAAAHDDTPRPRPAAEVHEPDWADCARAMRDAIEESISGFDGRRWLAREAIEQQNTELQLRLSAIEQQYPAPISGAALPSGKSTGVYGDGCIASQATFFAQQRSRCDRMILRGYIPEFSVHVSTKVSVSLDGRSAKTAEFGHGSFEMEMPLEANEGVTRVDIATARTPDGDPNDPRDLAFVLTEVHFVDASLAATERRAAAVVEAAAENARLRDELDALSRIRKSIVFKILKPAIKGEIALRDGTRTLRHKLKPSRKTHAAQIEISDGINAPGAPGPAQIEVSDGINAPGAPGPALMIRVQPLTGTPPLPAVSTRSLLVCVSHVSPSPPRAGNEYRLHRLLLWLQSNGWDVLLVVCPLPGDELSDTQIAALGRNHPNVVIVERDGTLRAQLARRDLADLVAGLDGIPVRNFTLLKQEDAATDQRLLSLTRAFCPDFLLELLTAVDHDLHPAVVQVNYCFMTRSLPLLRAETLKIVDTHDIFSTKASKVHRFNVADELVLTPDEEQHLLRHADVVLAIQPDDAGELRNLGIRARVLTVGVDMPDPPRVRRMAEQPVVLLVGSDNQMNRKGLNDFLRFAWPTVLQAVPEARLRVIGSVGKCLSGYERNVHWLGHVDDLNLAYAQARLVINPAVAGTGLKIKTLEALGRLRPIVLWPSGMDGISPELRTHCQCVHDWFQFTRSVIRTLSDPDAGNRLFDARDTIARLLSQDHLYAEYHALLSSRR